MTYSIVIPVYNTMPWLRQCVDSVLSQTFGDFEIILVNDGSTDESGALCDALSIEDSRIRVIHQSNAGLPGARNTGIAAARGEWLLFIDSDDFYADAGVLERLNRHDADVVCFNYRRQQGPHDDAGPGTIYTRGQMPAAHDDAFAWLVRCNAWSSSACLKRVRTSLLQQNKLFFKAGQLSEDIEWSASLATLAESFAWDGQVAYVYRVREGSITDSFSQDHVEDLVAICRRLAGGPPGGKSTVFGQAYMGYAAFQYCTLLINIRFPDKAFLKANLAACRPLRFLLRYDQYSIVKLVRIVSALVGLRGCSWLMFHAFTAGRGR